MAHPTEANASQASTSKFVQRGCSTRGEKNTSRDEPNDAVISVDAPFSVLDLKCTTTKLPHAETPPCSNAASPSVDKRTFSGKRFVSANLGAPESSADATSTESQRFRRSRLAKAVIRRVAAVLTTQVSTCKHGLDAQPKKCFQQDVLSLSWRSDWAMRTTIEKRQSNTMLNNVEKRVRSFFRSRFKCLTWIS